MAAVIRLRKMGKKKRPYFRIVVLDRRNPRDGDYIESLGYYHPIDGNEAMKIDTAKYEEWKSKGAIPSPVVKDILRKYKKLQAQ